MKIVFFEVQDWERELLKTAFPQSILVEDKLTAENAAHYADTEVASCFIYSTFTKEALEKLPNLKLVSTRSTGFDHIDVTTAKEKNISVANVPEYGSHTVAEHTFSLILALTRKLYQSINQAKQFDFDHRNIQGVDLYGKTLGIIGLGKIGINVLKMAKGFGMNVVVYTRTRDEKLAQELDFEYEEITDLLQKSDIVTLHLPYNEHTHHTINRDNIVKMKKGSYLINTARGGLIDTEAIILGLGIGILAGVGMDVLEEEKELSEELEILTTDYHEKVDFKTLVLDHALMNHPKVIITPHNAFNSKEALDRITHTTIDNIKAFLEEKPINLVTV